MKDIIKLLLIFVAIAAAAGYFGFEKEDIKEIITEGTKIIKQ